MSSSLAPVRRYVNGANFFVVGSVVAFPADVFVWLPSGVTLVGANTFVVGSVAEWLGIRLETGVQFPAESHVHSFP